MRTGGGKQKGAEFEREVCRKLSLWITRGGNEAVFWRSAMSGGRATLAARQGQILSTQEGDISAIHPKGIPLTDLFEVECKFYHDLKLGGMLYQGKTGGINEFWHALLMRTRKLPMLIAKQNRTEAVVLLSSRGAFLFHMQGYELARFPTHDANMFVFNDFLQKASVTFHQPPLKLRSRK